MRLNLIREAQRQETLEELQKTTNELKRLYASEIKRKHFRWYKRLWRTIRYKKPKIVWEYRK